MLTAQSSNNKSFVLSLLLILLQALSLQLLAAVVAGFLFTAIVLVDSHAWIYINTKCVLTKM